MISKEIKRLIHGLRGSGRGRDARLLGDIHYRRSGPVAVVPPSEASLRGTVTAFNEKLLLLDVLEAKEGSSGSSRYRRARRKTES
jgi:hypothetical protein